MRITAILIFCIEILGSLLPACAASVNRVATSAQMLLTIERYAIVTCMDVNPDMISLSCGGCCRTVTLAVQIPKLLQGYVLHLDTVTINGQPLAPAGGGGCHEDGTGTEYLMNTDTVRLRFDQDDFLRAIGTSAGTHIVTLSAEFAGCGVLNATGNVLLLTAPEIPVLLAPGNGVIGISCSPTLSWANAAGAARYTLEISDSVNFSGATRYTSIMTTNMPFSGLTPGKTYYWRVLAVNIYGNSAFSPAWSFTIGMPPTAPVLFSPGNNATGISVNPTISWKSVSNASSYTLEIASDGSFTKNVQSYPNLTGTSKTLSGLAAGKNYYWHVKACNPFGNSDFSAGWHFTCAKK